MFRMDLRLREKFSVEGRYLVPPFVLDVNIVNLLHGRSNSVFHINVDLLGGTNEGQERLWMECQV